MGDSWEVGGRVPCRPLCGDRLHHLELACKFFLVASEEEEERTEGPTILRSPWSAMVGPDGDTLEWKYHKMKDVQLRRSGVAPLKDLLREDPMRWKWMYGRHFRHFSKLQQPLGIFWNRVWGLYHGVRFYPPRLWASSHRHAVADTTRPVGPPGNRKASPHCCCCCCRSILD